MPKDDSAFGGFDYITWLGPGLLAAMAMQTATFESTYPIMNKIMWGRNYEAMLSTPLQIRNIVWGELAWSAFRIGTLAVIFLVVLVPLRHPAVAAGRAGHSVHDPHRRSRSAPA